MSLVPKFSGGCLVTRPLESHLTFAKLKNREREPLQISFLQSSSSLR